tara:strand:+ start:6474 stop:7544 length:1071 start_codon:yes stop_codon:yes gene_type:complete
MAGVKLDLVTDTSDIKKGFKDVEGALEDVSDSLDDVANDAEDAGQKMERSFSDVAKETKKEARDMGKEVGGSYDKMARDSGEATGQMKEDGFSNAKEVAASFDGSAESIVDGFQGAAAEMFSGFGPAGAAAGLAAAAGLGLITAELQKSKEKAAENAEATWTMAQEMVDAGIYMVTEAQKINLFEELVGDETERKKVAGDLDAIGITWTDFIAGQVGLGDKRQEVEGKILGYYQEQESAMKGIEDTDESRITKAAVLEQSQRRLLDRYDETERMQQEAVRTAEDIRKTYRDAGVELNDNKIELGLIKQEAAMVARQDATPKFDMSAAFKQVDDLQTRLNRLKVPNLTANVTVRTVK